MTISSAETVDLSPAWQGRAGDFRWSVNAFVDWATNDTFRQRLMSAVGFPTKDTIDFLVVNQIAHNGALRPSDLADSLSLSRTHVSKIVNRLVGAKLVTRVPVADDERSVLIALTPSGRQVGTAILDVLDDMWQRTLAEWSPKDRDKLQALFARLIHDIGIDRRDDARTPARPHESLLRTTDRRAPARQSGD